MLTIGNGIALGSINLVLACGALNSNGAYTVTNNYTLTAASSIGGANNLTLNGTGGLGANALTVNNTAGTITLGGEIGRASCRERVEVCGKVLWSEENSDIGGTKVHE